MSQTPHHGHRPPPAHVNRTTRRGADQHVLACNARRDADDVAFAGILEREQELQRMRAELTWQLEHAATRTEKWVRSKASVAVMILATIAGVYGWMFTPNGKQARVGYVIASGEASADQDIWKTPHFMTSDMPQAEIDAIVAERAARVAREVK